MWRADQDKRPMILAIIGTVLALVILSGAWMFWHAPTERQPVDSWKTDGTTVTPAQRSEPLILKPNWGHIGE